MWSKLGFITFFVIFAWTNATPLFSEADKNLTAWYSSSVDLYERKLLQSRVIVGRPAQRHQLPWHVLIDVQSGASGGWATTQRTCAGSLISSHYVLTEANALRSGNRYECVLGAHDRNNRRFVRRASNVFYHPKSAAGEGNFNVAILQLDRAFTAFSKDVRPVQLASADSSYANTYGWVSGFGAASNTPNDLVQWAAVRVLTNEECQEAFPGVDEGSYCTIGHDAFHAGPGLGDGGCSLVALERGRYVQFGVFAFSWRDDFTRPSGYVSVGAIRSWIRTASGV